jgi:hypothetical protein
MILDGFFNAPGTSQRKEKKKLGSLSIYRQADDMVTVTGASDYPHPHAHSSWNLPHPPHPQHHFASPPLFVGVAIQIVGGLLELIGLTLIDFYHHFL